MMNIVELRVADLKEYENNPRLNDNAVEAVAESIMQFGFKVPIIIDEDNVIVAGHTRLKAARMLGMECVPCIVADDLTDEQIKAFRLADNKVSEFAEWDFSALEKELEEIEMDMSVFGFEFDFAECEESQELVEDDVPEITEETICKKGDVWKLGTHRLVCGDSTDESTLAKLMQGTKADLLLTDPPYNVNYEGKTKNGMKIENDSMSGEDFKTFLTSAFARAKENLKDGGSFYVWYASREHINFESSLSDVGLNVRQQLIWVKNSLVLSRQDYHWKHEPCLYGWKDGASHKWYGDRTQTTVLEFDRPTRNAEHPTMKPLDLIGYQIQNSSQKDDVVLDLFGGSGSTLIACEQLGRTCYMCELDERYCDVIIKRWETLTGNVAERI